MRPEIKAVIAFVCGIAALIGASFDWIFIVSCVLGIVGILTARSALSSDISPSGRGMAVAGTLSCAFAVCVAFGAILGYTAAYMM